jgi:predicted metal-dependent hydrolase
VSATALPLLRGYPESVQSQVQVLITQNRLSDWLLQKYPQAHGIRTDGALYNYVTELKNEFMRNADAVSKVAFDSKIHVIQNALGLHSTISRVQGSKLKSKREIKLAAVFKDTPMEFLRMISVHELAHLRIRDHDRAFYQLCAHMEPAYHQLEFDLRVYLTHLELTGERLWAPSPKP